MKRTLLPIWIFVCLVGPLTDLSFSADTSGDIDFSRDIRPLLSDRCISCHGPDAAKREAGLRLDLSEAATAELESGATAIVPGDVEASELVRRIRATDEAERMPPVDSGKKLSAAEIALIEAWIKSGAKYEQHWAFIAPSRPKTPPVKNGAWPRGDIDRFVLARLEREGLTPSQEASRETLIRRVSFDLIGLPPTIEEIDAFLADTNANAYEKVVDRLLASPHFGERMAVAWLDAARYGDSSVFHADGPRNMWPWRDWVIRAYNSNMPFDQFTIEQLAGDLLPNATADQKVATAFNRNNATTDEGGAIAEEFRVEYAIDRVKTTSQVWLGLTMECAQCHDHKYDPISQRDYYRFFAYFNQAADPGLQTRKGNQPPLANVFDPQMTAKAEQMKMRLAKLETQIAQRSSEVEPQFTAWLNQAATAQGDESQSPEGLYAKLTFDDADGSEAALVVNAKRHAAKLNGKASWAEGKLSGGLQLTNGGFLDVGDFGDFERNQAFSYGAWIKPVGGGNGAPIARMDNRNFHRGYDLFVHGNRVAVHLIHRWPTNAIKINVTAPLKSDVWQHVFVTYDGSSKAAGLKVYFDGVPQAWTVEQDRLSDTIHTAASLYIGRRSHNYSFSGSVDDVRLYTRELTAAEIAQLAGRDNISRILALPAESWSDADRNALMSHYLTHHDEKYLALNREITQIKADIAAAEKPISNVMVMQDTAKPRMTYVLERGVYDAPRKDDPLQPGVPAALPPLSDDAPPNRLGLARWIVRPDHPLTSRVAVNRMWEMFMGAGLVRTVEDFGAQGEMPSHESLLDWLSVDFVEHGWDVKRAVKQIVMSSTYRQSSRITPELAQADPENRLYARGPRFRLQAEFIRDNALAASGLLVTTVGGPSVKPYQPPGLWAEVSLSGERFVQDHGDKLYRRTLYTYIKRSAPAPMLLIFDAPTREKCTLRRPRTNTPLQALVTMNDPQFVEAARVLAERAMKHGGKTLDEQIAYAYRLATGRQPSALARETLKTAHATERVIFQADPARTKSLLAIGEMKRDESLDAVEHAAMTIVCSMILNLDATLTRS